MIHFGSDRPELAATHSQHGLFARAMSILDKSLQFDSELGKSVAQTTDNIRKWHKMESLIQNLASRAEEAQSNPVFLDCRGTTLVTTKSTILKSELLYSLYSARSDPGKPLPVDRDPQAVDAMLEFLRFGPARERDYSTLEVDLNYFGVERPGPLAEMGMWYYISHSFNIRLSLDGSTATKDRNFINLDSYVVGCKPVTYCKLVYQHEPGCLSRCMIGLTPEKEDPNKLMHNEQINVNRGYFICTADSRLYSRETGDYGRKFMCERCPILPGTTLEFRYDEENRTISIRTSQYSDFHVAFTNVLGGDLYPAVDFCHVGESVRLVEIRD